jgi:hypothetical protein
VNIASLVSRFSTGTYTVTRTARGSVVRGRVQDGTETTFDITASISPATGNDLLKLPEGRRAVETRRLFTTTLLTVGGQGEANEADSVSIGGADWLVQHVERWQDSQSTGICYSCLVQCVR